MVSSLMCRTQLFADLSLNIIVNSNEQNHTVTEKTENDLIDDIRPEIWFRIPFLGKQGEFFGKKLLRKYSVISHKRSNLL